MASAGGEDGHHADNAEVVADEVEYEVEPSSGGSVGSEEEDEVDEDYVPPGHVHVRSGGADAHAPTIVLLDDDTVQVEAPRRSARAHEAGEEPRRADGEALDGAEEAKSAPRGGSGDEEGEAGESDMSLSNCPICMERWTSQGVHRVCCIPCGHVYGRSCLERWIRRCGNSFAKCPQCNRRFKRKDIVNLYVPQVTVINDDLEKEVIFLREKNEMLSIERKKLLEEVNKLKKQSLYQGFHVGAQMRTSTFVNDSRSYPGQTSSGPCFPFAHSGQGPSFSGAFILKTETSVDGARVLDIDACNQILLVSRRPSGWTGGHVLTKVSFLCPNAMQDVQLPDDVGIVKDLHFAPRTTLLPGRLALLASLGKKLSVFSMELNNVVLKYNLPEPSWSCSWNLDDPFQIYAGLQDGTLLTFDVRQTTRPLESRPGLSRHPVHTVRSFEQNEPFGGTRAVLTASSVGLCLWYSDNRETSPRRLLSQLDNEGICVSLAGNTSGDDIVASFRPKFEMNSDAAGSQLSQNLSPTVSRPVMLGTHVYFKRLCGNIFQRRETISGNVSEVRMSRSAVLEIGGGTPLFVYGDEASHGLCIWDLASFQVVQRLKPHEHPIYDIKYSGSVAVPGLLGCVSENRLQVFRVNCS